MHKQGCNGRGVHNDVYATYPPSPLHHQDVSQTLYAYGGGLKRSCKCVQEPSKGVLPHPPNYGSSISTFS